LKIGDFIRLLREKKNWLQGDLSRESGIGQTNLSYIEKYSRMPNFDIACKICEALGITPNILWKNIRIDYLENESFNEELPENKRARGSPNPGQQP